MMLSGMAGLDGELKTLQPLRSSLGFVHALPPNNGAQNFGLQNFWRRYGGDVAIEYDNWATETVARFCAALSPAQLELTTPGTMGTAKATLIHLVGAKERYAAALRGTPPPDDATKCATHWVGPGT